MPAFIATLGMQQAARGLALYFTGGQNILQLGNFVKIGQGMVGPVPVPVILVILVTIVVWYLQSVLSRKSIPNFRKAQISPMHALPVMVRLV